MDGWMDGWMDGLMDKWIDEWINRFFFLVDSFINYMSFKIDINHIP
jgi:hypothetical protein